MPSLHPSRPTSFLGIMVDRDSAVNTVVNVWHPEWPSELHRRFARWTVMARHPQSKKRVGPH